MIRSLIYTALVSTFLTGFAPADILVKDGQKIAFLGDSITAGGWGAPDGYVHLVVAGLGTLGAKVTPIPAGVSGHTSRDMLNRYTNDVLNQKPDWVTISCGVNDVWHGASGCTLEEYSKNITSMVDQAQAAGIKVLLMTSTPIGEEDNDNNKKLVPYNDFLHKLAADRHLPVAEENDAFWGEIKKSGPTLAGDGVHPNTDGSIVMARSLLAGFGATPAQVDQAQAAWTDIPASNVFGVSFNFNCGQSVSLKEYAALKALAAGKKMNVTQMLDPILVQTIDETMQAHKSDPSFNSGALQNQTQTAFIAKVKSLVK